MKHKLHRGDAEESLQSRAERGNPIVERNLRLDLKLILETMFVRN